MPRELLYGAEATAAEVNETRYTQPLLYALEWSLYELWRVLGVEPRYVMGHSVGEYVAAAVAGVFTMEQGLELVSHRGRLMWELCERGTMVQVRCEPETAERALQGLEQAAGIGAYNERSSVVVSGSHEAIGTVIGRLRSQGVECKELVVSHGFHSPQMDAMLEEFERHARRVSYRTPQIGLVSNVTGRVAGAEVADALYWVRHVREPVRFVQSLETVKAQGVQTFLEV